MAFAGFDSARVARALGLLCTAEGDHADAFFERRERVEATGRERGPGVRVLREEGFALRLVRGGRSWVASRDEVGDEPFARAFRQVARSLPPALPALRGLEPLAGPTLEESDELLGFAARVERELRELRVAFPFRISVRRHRRHTLVVSPRLQAEPQSEDFYALDAEIPWGRWGTLVDGLAGAERRTAAALAELFRARDQAPPEDAATVVVLAPAAAAVFLHEAVAHPLEADTLALTGKPSAAVGVRLGSELLDVLDDPARAPGPVRRTCDDEGIPVSRRWLLRDGRVEEPIADRFWSERAGLQPGAGRRSHRHRLPAPRSHHLELLPGTSSSEDLMSDAAGGLYVQEVERGRLDPFSGRFTLDAACARRIEAGGLGARTGPLRVAGSVVELLSAVTAVGAEVESGGAGWCAKGGDRLPVWATSAALRLEGVQVAPR